MNKILGIILLAVLLVVGVFVFLSLQEKPQKKIENVPVAKAPNLHKVVLADSGFTPLNSKIKKGETIIWVNESSNVATVNSDPHPTHNRFRFLNLGNFSQGSSVQATFEDAGTFTYHNHLNSAQKGVIIVK